MADLSIHHVHQVQHLLSSSGIKSVVVGDVAMNYFGVDVVTHNIEICVPRRDMERSIKELQARKDLYQRLPDLEEPDFYHPYKRGAVRFHVHNLEPGLELQIIADEMLGLNVANLTGSECGLTQSTAHEEIQCFTKNVGDEILSAVRWPTFTAYFKAWLKSAAIASKKGDYVGETISLMQAERLIDTRDVDEAWLKKNTCDPEEYQKAARLLRGKPGRIAEKSWV